VSAQPITRHPLQPSPAVVEAILAIAVLALVLLVYLSTLQIDVSGSHSEYTLDTGEFQMALNLGGTLHPTGYPLYALLGWPFAAAARALGATPAASASLFSLVWSVGTLALVIAMVIQVGGSAWHGAVAALVLSATHSFWVHSVIAEVYSLSLFLTALCLWLALRCARRPSLLPWLGLALGLAIGHHRSAVLMLPALGLFLIASGVFRRLRRSTIALASLALAGSFLVYLYLPWRASQGAPWVYGQPDTWQGFGDIFFAAEYRGLMQLTADPGAIVQNLLAVLQLMAGALTPVLLGLGWLGIVAALAAPRSRWPAAMFALTGLASVAFAVVLPAAVFLPAVLLSATLVTALGVGLALAVLGSWRAWLGALVGLAIAVLAVSTGIQTRPAVVEYSRNRIGREVLNSIKALDESVPPLVAPWGTDYFALAYGKWLTREIADAKLLSPADDLSAALDQDGVLYLPRDQFYTYPPDYWRQRYGPVCLSSAGWRLVSVRRAPCAGDAPASTAPLAMFGDQIALDSLAVTAQPDMRSLVATIGWRALRQPDADYSVGVFLGDGTAIAGPEDVVAQEDHAHPVYGLWPTSQWEPGGTVREDYQLSWPAGRQPALILVRLYHRDPASGAFETLGEYSAPLAPLVR